MTMDLFPRPTTRQVLNGSRDHLPREMTENDSSRVRIVLITSFAPEGDLQCMGIAHTLPRRREGDENNYKVCL